MAGKRTHSPGDNPLTTTSIMTRKKPGPKPNPEGPREDLIAIKCRSEYKTWVKSMAKKRRVTPSQLVDIALARMAEQDGDEPPPER
jgi:hypothetical protein